MSEQTLPAGSSPPGGRLGSRFSQLRGYWASGGLDLVQEVLCVNGYLPPWLFDLAEMHVLRLTELNERPMRRVSTAYEGGEVREAELPVVAALEDPAGAVEREADYRAYLADGQRCLVVRYEDEVVAYGWVFHDRFEAGRGPGRAAIHLRLRPGDVMLGHGYVVPGHRLRGAFLSLAATAVVNVPRGGACYAVVDRLNVHSRRSHERLGFVPVARLRARRWPFGGYRWRGGPWSGGMHVIGRGVPEVGLDSLLG
ncbi:N-acetyltransferase family protein [Arhodomonas sp. KWT2]|uniref:GNAT family N-acetyltransferase n=1 Tax=Arhodomonas sp. KWT2 TaxID=3344194 RepID=UPI0035BFBE0D